MDTIFDPHAVHLISESQSVRYQGFAAFCFLVWDIIITYGDEVEYIWPQSNRSPTKWVYLFTRYFALAAQIRLMVINMGLQLGTFSLEVCRMFYITQVITCGVLMACTQSLLMLRVYALYIKDKRIAYGLATLLVAEVGSMPGLIASTLPQDLGKMCMKPITVRDIALFGVSAVLPQCLVLGLTVYKFCSGLRDGWGKLPMVSTLVRDDIILVFAIVFWIVLFACLTSINNIYGYMGYYWLLSLIPVIGCRVVINMQRLAGQPLYHLREAEDREGASERQLSSCVFNGVLTVPDTVNSGSRNESRTPGTPGSSSASRTPSRVSGITPARLTPQQEEYQASDNNSIQLVKRDTPVVQRSYSTPSLRHVEGGSLDM